MNYHLETEHTGTLTMSVKALCVDSKIHHGEKQKKKVKFGLHKFCSTSDLHS